MPFAFRGVVRVFASALVVMTVLGIAHPAFAQLNVGSKGVPVQQTTGANDYVFSAVWIDTGSVSATLTVSCTGVVTSCTFPGGATSKNVTLNFVPYGQELMYTTTGGGSGRIVMHASTTSPAEVDSGWANVTVPIVHAATVTVSPTSMVGTPGQNSGTTFTVTNTGNVTDQLWFYNQCNGPVFSWCGGLGFGGALLQAGHDTTVGTQWGSGPAGSNGVVLLNVVENNGVSVSAVQQVTTAANPGLDVVDANPGVSFDRANCLTIAMGPGAASECTDLRLTHPLPAVRTYDQVRVPTLLYNWRFAQTAVNLGGLLTIGASSRKLDSVTANLWVWPHGHPTGVAASTGWWPSIDWDSAAALTTRRIEMYWPGASSGEQSGYYDYALATTRYYKIPGQADSTPKDSAAGQFINVTRANSPYGEGWWLVGLEQLFFYGTGTRSDTIAWIGGDGSTQLYIATDSTNMVWKPQTYVSGRDSIVWVSQHNMFERQGPHGWRVGFTTDGQMWYRINYAGDTTRFYHPASTPEVDSIEPPIPVASDTMVRYALYYDASGTLDSVRAPGSPTRRTVYFHDSLLVAGNSKSIMRITDPDLQTVSFGVDPNAVLRINSRTDKRGTTTVFGYGLDAEGFGYSDTQMQDTSVSDIVRTLFMSNLNGFSAYWIPHNQTHSMALDSGFISYHGPRSNSTHGTDLSDITTIWVDRRWQPTMIQDALGNITTIRRDNPTYPTRVTQVQDASGRVQLVTYNSRGYDSTYTDLGTYLNKSDTTYYTYDQRWDVDTLTTLPLKETLHDGYDGNGNHTFHQVGSSSSHRVTYNYAGMCAGLVSSVVLPQTPSDSLLYDAARCNLSAEQTPRGYWSNYTTDSAGRITQVTTPIDSNDKSLGLMGYARAQTNHTFDAMDREYETQTIGPALNGAEAQTMSVLRAFDPNGNVLTVKRSAAPNDAHLDTLHTATIYDRANRPKVDTLLGQGVRTRRFDAASNVVSVVTPRTYTITSSYDALNRLVSKIVPSFTDTTWITSIPNPSGLLDPHYHLPADTIWYGQWGRVGYGGQLVHGDTVSFKYDAVGRLTTADNTNAHIGRQYYANGLLQSETDSVRTAPDPGNFTTHIYTVGYHYDLDSRRDSLYFPWVLGAASENGYIGTTQAYTYNGTTGWLDTITDPLGHKFSFGYVSRGDLDTLLMPGSYREIRAYDNDGNLATDYVDKTTTPDTVWRNATFAYDAREKALYSNNSQGLKNSMTTQYSGLGFLVSESRTDTVPTNGTTASSTGAYTYDALGNKLYENTTNGVFQQFGYQTSNNPTFWGFDTTTGRLTLSDGNLGLGATYGNWVYDKSGNTSFYYTLFNTSNQPNVIYDRASFYNAEERLVEADYREVTDPELKNNPIGFLKRVDEVSEYDALGRRVAVFANRFCGPSGGVGEYAFSLLCNRTLARRTVWDGTQELAEFQVQDSTPVIENDEGVVQLAWDHVTHVDNNPYFGQVMYVHGLTTDQPLAVIRLNYASASDPSGDSLPYYVSPPTEILPMWNSVGRMDIILSPNYCSTGPNGRQRCPLMVDQLGFGAYNNISELGPPSYMGSLLEDKAEQTFTQFRRNRFYDPVTGRFTQADPIGLAGGVNDYGFAAGDPVNYSDPFGLCPPAKEGFYCIDLFIRSGRVMGIGRGDGRGPDPNAPASASRVQIMVDVAHGKASWTTSPSCFAGGIACASPRTDNTVKMTAGQDGSLTLDVNFKNSLDPTSITGSIHGSYTFTPDGQGGYESHGSMTAFPSDYIYQGTANGWKQVHGHDETKIGDLKQSGGDKW
jgi:RHS repeat-associated protein